MTLSFFPKTNLTSEGKSFEVQNLDQIQAFGTIKAVRPAQSKKTPSLFAIVDIKVKDKPGVFQDFLHFTGGEKEQASLDFLTSHATQAALSAGKKVKVGEKKMEWVANIWEHLIGAQVYFRQTRNGTNTDIVYLPQEDMEEEESDDSNPFEN